MPPEDAIEPERRTVTVCPVEGCAAERAGRILCARHTAMIPEPCREELNRADDLYRHAVAPAEFAAAHRAWILAATNATRAVNAILAGTRREIYAEGRKTHDDQTRQ
jgi:hypothetical protein